MSFKTLSVLLKKWHIYINTGVTGILPKFLSTFYLNRHIHLLKIFCRCIHSLTMLVRLQTESTKNFNKIYILNLYLLYYY